MTGGPAATRVADSSAPRPDERGAVLLLFALSIAAIATLAALVLGGSIGYSAARNAQTAADAAALAATSQLREVTAGSTAPAEVAATAISVAESNGATPGTVICEIVAPRYAINRSAAEVIGPCNGVNELHPLAAGVRVTVTDRRGVPFGSFVGSENISAHATATATVQPIRGLRAPFMVCGRATAIGHPQPPLIPDPLSVPPWAVNPIAIGESFVLWGNAVNEDGRDCEALDSAWRGEIRRDKTFPIPSPDLIDETDWFEGVSGNATGGVDRNVAEKAACEVPDGHTVASFPIGCRVAVPLCTHTNLKTGSQMRVHCVAVAVFEITYVSGTSSGTAPCHPTQKLNIICGTMIGPGLAVGAATAAAIPDGNAVVVIRLVE